VSPNVIVNAAAYTAVDNAEIEPAIARTVNAEAPGVMAREAEKAGAWMIHYSTDYVYDGSGTNAWREDDVPTPLSVYGATKLAGDDAIRASGCRHLIFRTCWVFADRGKNFVTAILQKARECERLDVVDDQIGAPTSAELVANVTARALRVLSEGQERAAVRGLYHLAPQGYTSRYGCAVYVIDAARSAGVPLKVRVIARASTTPDPAKARRPHNSRLDTTKLQTTFGVQLPHWQQGLERALKRMFDVHA
jgi:dTDP-4-dehydrorhamnose reductase